MLGAFYLNLYPLVIVGQRKIPFRNRFYMYIIYYLYYINIFPFKCQYMYPSQVRLPEGFLCTHPRRREGFSCGNQEVVPVEQGSGNRKPVQKNPTCGSLVDENHCFAVDFPSIHACEYCLFRLVQTIYIYIYTYSYIYI